MKVGGSDSSAPCGATTSSRYAARCNDESSARAGATVVERGGTIPGRVIRAHAGAALLVAPNIRVRVVVDDGEYVRLIHAAWVLGTRRARGTAWRNHPADDPRAEVWSIHTGWPCTRASITAT